MEENKNRFAIAKAELAEIAFDYVTQVQRTDFGDYKGLYWHERLAINSYLLTNDTLPIQAIITKKEYSQGMACFINDMIAGKIRRASKGARTILDKMECYRVINALMAGKTLDEALDSFARCLGKPERTIPQRVITKNKAFDIIAVRENQARETIITRYYEGKEAIREKQEEQLRAFVKETMPEKHWIK